jgi:hypothetical protein
MHKVFQAYDAMTAESLFKMKGTQKKISLQCNPQEGIGVLEQGLMRSIQTPFSHSKRKRIKLVLIAYKVSVILFCTDSWLCTNVYTTIVLKS